MKQFFFIGLVALLYFFAPTTHAEVPLGQETIKPLRFPKFTVGGEYALMRKFRAFNGSDFRAGLKNSYGVNLHAEAGLIRYLNAGVTASFTMSSPFLDGSNILRMGLFLKPYLPLGSRVSLFSRLSLGGSATILNEALFYKLAANSTIGEIPPGIEKYKRTYGTQFYLPISAGLNGAATIGLEAFITLRIGVVAEWGIRSDMLWAKILKSERLREFDAPPASGNPPPNWFHYLIYDMPVMVSLNIIL